MKDSLDLCDPCKTILQSPTFLAPHYKKLLIHEIFYSVTRTIDPSWEREVDTIIKEILLKYEDRRYKSHFMSIKKKYGRQQNYIHFMKK